MKKTATTTRKKNQTKAKVSLPLSLSVLSLVSTCYFVFISFLSLFPLIGFASFVAKRKAPHPGASIKTKPTKNAKPATDSGDDNDEE